jgi:calcium/calmodulin-dependent protein kinase I
MTGRQAKDVDLLDTVRENFNARRTFKSAISAVQAMNRIRRHSLPKNDPHKTKASTSIVAPTALGVIDSNDAGTDVPRVKTVQ